MDLLISAGVAFITALVASLAAPWVHWAIEKRRSSMQYKKELISNWRRELAECGDDADEFMRTAVYGSLRPHLSPDAVKTLEAPMTFYAHRGVGLGKKEETIADEIARIEREWDLV